MRHKQQKYLIAFLILITIMSAKQYGQQYSAEYLKYNKDFIHPDIYKARRAKLIQSMEPKSIAIFISGTPKNRTTDMEYPYKQNPNFQYLTGCLEKFSILILLSEDIEIEGIKTKEIFFTFVFPPSYELFVGKSFGAEGAKDLLKLDVSFSFNDFNKYFPKIMEGKKYVYLSPSNGVTQYEPITGVTISTFEEFCSALSERYPGVLLKTNLDAIVSNMRLVKDKSEIDYLKKAVDATGKGLVKIAKSCKPDIYEYELQAEFEYSVKKEGCQSFGYTPIVASGPNTNILHYDINRRLIKMGDLVSLDVGAEYNGYSADITRVFPVNGKFNKQQKEIYELVLKANRELIKIIKPGVTMKTLDSLSRNILADGLIKLGIIKDKNKYIGNYPYPVAHDVGLEPHDAFGYEQPLVAGQVVAVEPGIYILENTPGVDKLYWNIGIRIEDNILITEKGNKVLSSEIPVTAAEIERLMKK